MPGWVGPVAAISLAIIAICYLGIAAIALITVKETLEQTKSVGRELKLLHEELSPALQAINRLGTSGAEITEMAREEVQELVLTARQLRQDVESGVQRTRERLADFEAVIEVVQEEVQDAALDFTTALRTVRTGTGMIGRLRKMMLPPRRGRE